MGSHPARGHVREFDGLRGLAILAILAVLLHHFWPRPGALAPDSPAAHSLSAPARAAEDGVTPTSARKLCGVNRFPPAGV